MPLYCALVFNLFRHDDCEKSTIVVLKSENAQQKEMSILFIFFVVVIFTLQRQGSGAAAGNNKTSAAQGKQQLVKLGKKRVHYEVYLHHQCHVQDKF